MMFLLTLAIFTLIVGMAVPPLLFVSAFCFYLCFASTKRGMRAVRATEEARAAKVATRSHEQATRFFA